MLSNFAVRMTENFYCYAHCLESYPSTCIFASRNKKKFVLKNNDFLPARSIRPISSLRPMLSKSMTMTSREHSLIFSQGTLNENASLKTGFRVHLKIGVLRFSTLFSPNCSHTLTYGSVKITNN